VPLVELCIPSTEPYSLTECLADLLELAAVTLVVAEHAILPPTITRKQCSCNPVALATVTLITGRRAAALCAPHALLCLLSHPSHKPCTVLLAD
jgi:hypothetical protein